MQRILLLSDINSVHTQRWIRALLQRKLQVGVFSLSNSRYDVASEFPGVRYYGLSNAEDSRRSRGWDKMRYILRLPLLKRCIRDFEPHIVHAHYASSYGLLGALSGFKPLFVSVWGSDVLVFPSKGTFHKKIINYTLGKAGRIFSTSQTLYDQVKSLCNRESTIIPFGIDVSQFHPQRSEVYYDASFLVIGTIKAMEANYRIDWIIRAFAKVQRLRPLVPMRLLIVGGGSLFLRLQELARKECMDDTVRFTGRISAADVPAAVAQLDVFVHAAVGESFGVSTLEAAACAKPAVVCKSGGASEVAIDGVTALCYAENDFEGLVRQLLRLVDDENLRFQLGTNAREFVIEKYNWQQNVDSMIAAYQSLSNTQPA